MEKLVTDNQFAAYLGMDVRTLRRKIQQNKIAIRFIPSLGRSLRFRPEEIERYIKSLEIIRDGSGRVTKPSTTKTRKNSKPRAIMTDEEAQEFFKGVKRDADGVLMCSDEEN
jgi:excisionase family DNA binding protein